MSMPMSVRKPIISTTIAARHVLRGSRVLQAMLLVAAWQCGQMVVRLAHWPIPGSVVGMLLVLLALLSRRLPLGSVKKGADWMLADMLLFFVPAVLAVMDHPEFLGWTGLKVLAVILLGTVIVMACTAMTVDLCFRLAGRRT